jgi:hypothetical protein
LAATDADQINRILALPQARLRSCTIRETANGRGWGATQHFLLEAEIWALPASRGHILDILGHAQ